MHLKITSILTLCCLLIACNQSPLDTTEAEKELTKTPAQAITEKSEKGIPQTWTSYFTEAEVTAITAIKQTFDHGLGDNNKDRGTAYLYTYHANRMRADYFNKYPYTLNYPYNGKFDLSLVKKEMPQLTRFLTNKCGFQAGENGEVIHFYCLKDEGPLMELMQNLGKENSLIASLHNDYFQQKSISQNAKEQLLMNAKETLDFEKEAHQLIYMFYQILRNEERLAIDKVNEV